MPRGPAPACHSESSVNPGTTAANSRSGSGFPIGRAGVPVLTALGRLAQRPHPERHQDAGHADREEGDLPGRQSNGACETSG